MPKSNLIDLINPDLDWSHVVDLLHEVEGSALGARMNARSLASGTVVPNERSRAIFTQSLLHVVLRAEMALNYVFPDPELDRDTESALRLLMTGVAEPDDPEDEDPPVRVPERP